MNKNNKHSYEYFEWIPSIRFSYKIFRSVFFLLLLGIMGCQQRCKVNIDSLPPGDPDNAGLLLPDGFQAVSVTEGVGRARHLVVNDNGDIYVKLSYNDVMNGRGGTVGLRDTDNDGKADIVSYFGDYKDEGGLACCLTIHNGYLYTSTVKNVLRTKLSPGKLVPDGKTEVVFTDTDKNAVHHWHTTKPVVFDNGGYMYVPFGAPDNACQDMSKYGPTGIPNKPSLDPCPDLETHAGIWRFDANETGLTQDDGDKFATGIRSVVGMRWNPRDSHLYAVMHGIDNFHTMFPSRFSSWQAAVLPAEGLLKVTEGSNFGWPYAYYDQMQGKNMLQPGYGGDGEKVGRASKFDKPVMGFPGHWAPNDLLFYQGDQFPDRYKEGAFIAFHGSTDRSPYPQAGYFICFVPFEKGVPAGKWEVFADGFAKVDTVVNTSDAVYRPMGLAEGPDGSLYISESNKGKIWRVMYKGDKKNFGKAQLAKMAKRETQSYIKTPDKIDDNLHKGSELQGRIFYNSYCASCHQRNGKGDNNRYPPLAGSGWVAGDKTRLIKIVLNGLQGKIEVDGKSYDGLMPPHGDILDDHAVASILTYIRSRFNNSADAVSHLEVNKVRKAIK